MIKKTIYTLLCTTMIISSPSLAAESVDTPIKVKFGQLKEEVQKNLPQTPDIESKVKSKIKFNILPKPTAERYFNQGVEREKAAREALKTQEIFKLDQEELNARAARDQKLREEEASKQVQARDQLIEEAKKEIALKSQAHETLKSQLSELLMEKSTLDGTVKKYEERLEKLNKELEVKAAMVEFSDEYAKDLQADIKLYETQLAETRAMAKEAGKKAAELELKLSQPSASEIAFEQGLKEILQVHPRPLEPNKEDKKQEEEGKQESLPSEEDNKEDKKQEEEGKHDSSSSEEEIADGTL